MEGDKGAGGGGSGQLPSSYPFSSPTHSAVSGSSYRRSISKKIPADTNSIDTSPRFFINLDYLLFYHLKLHFKITI